VRTLAVAGKRGSMHLISGGAQWRQHAGVVRVDRCLAASALRVAFRFAFAKRLDGARDGRQGSNGVNPAVNLPSIRAWRPRFFHAGAASVPVKLEAEPASRVPSRCSHAVVTL
jgi:hypothetical protein